MSARKSKECVIGVDVGTGSARAGIFTLDGEMLSSADHPLQIFRPRPKHVEQSSADIWNAVCHAVRDALRKASVAAEDVVGISFDATCSLVALDAQDNPITVSTDKDPAQNVILWMDHRAEWQAEEINRTGHPVLDYVGGKISPEQEPPKLKWLKENLPDTWRDAGKFLDLADYLVYEACKHDVRSLCTVVCKWTYMGHEGEQGRWDETFFDGIDLADLFARDRIGPVQPMGRRAGGLTPRAAEALGLCEGTPVGVGIIDAHAGGLGSLGMRAAGESADTDQIENALALIGGTSSCHMAVAPEARFVEGVWGPYYGAMVPEMWLAEGGQSATGALIDHVVLNHAYYPKLKEEAETTQCTVYELLNHRVAELRAAGAGEYLTEDLHVLPDFHGNRSPRADPHARGMISGLTLDSSFDSLALLYYATIQAVAYGTRHIIETLNRHGYRITRIHASGGGTRNPLWLQEHADITRCPVYVAKDCDAVLLGAAMLGAVAAGKHHSILEAMSAMSPVAEVIWPNKNSYEFHDRKYRVFQAMYEDQQAYKSMMRTTR